MTETKIDSIIKITNDLIGNKVTKKKSLDGGECSVPLAGHTGEKRKQSIID